MVEKRGRRGLGNLHPRFLIGLHYIFFNIRLVVNAVGLKHLNSIQIDNNG